MQNLKLDLPLGVVNSALNALAQQGVANQNAIQEIQAQCTAQLKPPAPADAGATSV